MIVLLRNCFALLELFLFFPMLFHDIFISPYPFIFYSYFVSKNTGSVLFFSVVMAFSFER